MSAAEIYFKIYKNYHYFSIGDHGEIITKSVSTDINYVPYNMLENLLSISDNESVIVLRSHATENKNVLLRIVACYKNFESLEKVKVKKTWFFIEDLLKCDVKGLIKEIKLIEEIKKKAQTSSEIFHCELTAGFRYFDWYVAEQISGVFFPKKQDLTLDFTNKICCLNNRFDQRRYILSSWLATKSRVDFSQYHSIAVQDLSTWSMIPKKYYEEIIQGAKILSNIDLRNMLPLDYISDRAVDNLIERTKDSFCSVITESRYDTHWPNFSEKTLRVITSGRPFILLAPAGTLRLLKDLGIETFSEFWDESYDLVEDPTERLSMVMDQIDMILDRTDHRQMLESMMPILEHNQKALKDVPKKMLSIS